MRLLLGGVEADPCVVDIKKGYKIKATCSKHFVLVTTLAVITAAKLLTKERGERID